LTCLTEKSFFIIKHPPTLTVCSTLVWLS